jgi:hypothetical protein
VLLAPQVAPPRAQHPPFFNTLGRFAMIGKALCSRIGILLSGQLSDQPGADVLTNVAAGHFAATGVVAAMSPASLPAQDVV